MGGGGWGVIVGGSPSKSCCSVLQPQTPESSWERRSIWARQMETVFVVIALTYSTKTRDSFLLFPFFSTFLGGRFRCRRVGSPEQTGRGGQRQEVEGKKEEKLLQAC